MEQQCLSYSNGIYSTVSLQVSLASEETRHVFQHHGWRTEIDLYHLDLCTEVFKHDRVMRVLVFLVADIVFGGRGTVLV